ncbi:MAG TPA: hypothetical protein VFI48_05030 [Hyphomicrobiaceae bacterium]|jgi:hypothetical protein|nr:hypothetical protein [Hyphomicrobiaceae bacterium]
MALAAAVGAGCLMLMAEVPAPLILPALSVVMVLFGFGMAASLYLKGSRLTGPPSAAWEVAGALVFFGFAAGILSNPGEAVAVLDEIASALAQRSHL